MTNKIKYLPTDNHEAKILTTKLIELEIADELIDLYDKSYDQEELQKVLDKLNALPNIENGCLQMINGLSLTIYGSNEMDAQILTLI